MSASSPILRSVSFARSTLVKDASGARARGILGSDFFDHIIRIYREIRASNQSTTVTTPRGGVIAAYLPRQRRLREPVEHGGPSHVLRAPAFLQGNAGTSGLGFLNLFRRLQAAGSLLLRAIVKDPQQSDGRFFVSLVFPEVLSSFRAAHGRNHAAWSVGNVGKAVGEFGNV